MVANAAAAKPNVKVAVTPMTMTERRINALLANDENWMLTADSLMSKFISLGRERRMKMLRGVQQFSLSEQLVSKSEGHREISATKILFRL
jgi:protein tyrosine phosphatase